MSSDWFTKSFCIMPRTVPESFQNLKNMSINCNIDQLRASTWGQNLSTPVDALRKIISWAPNRRPDPETVKISLLKFCFPFFQIVPKLQRLFFNNKFNSSPTPSCTEKKNIVSFLNESLKNFYNLFYQLNVGTPPSSIIVLSISRKNGAF